MQKGSTTRDAATGARTATGATEPRRSTRDRLVHEVVRFGLMFVYLWVVFGLFVLHERIIRGQMGLGFQAQGFVLINALVLAKVMLVAEDLRLDRGLRGQPLAYAAAGEAVLFAIVFIVFHVLERLRSASGTDRLSRTACRPSAAAASRVSSASRRSCSSC